MTAHRTGTNNDDLRIQPLTLAPDVIARFIAEVYDSYGHGTSFVPRWTAAFLDRVVFKNPLSTPDHALAAYAGDRLVGIIMAQPHEVWIGQRRHRAAYSSWLAVTREGARQFAALQLVNALRDRLQAQGVEVIFGLAYRSGQSVGLNFWEGFARAFPTDVTVGPDLKFWSRVLDGRAFAKGVKSPLLRVGAYASYVRPVMQPAADPAIRPFADADFEACAAIMEAAGTAGTSDMRIAPSRWELACADAADQGPQTLVMHGPDGPAAFGSYHILPMEDAGPMRVAMIELLNARHGTRGIGRMLRHVLGHAKASGASLAVIPRKPHLSTPFMLAAGFVPYEAGFKMLYLPLADSVPPQMPTQFDMLVR